MAVERADSRLRSTIRTKDPRRLFTGERTWSPLDKTEMVVLQLDKVPLRIAGFSKVVKMDPVMDDTIHYFDLIIYGPGSTEFREQRIVRGGEINKPEEPWHGIVRYSKTPSADN